MKFIIVFVASIVFVALFRKPIRNYSLLFYGLALIFNLIFFISVLGVQPRWVTNIIFILMQKNTLALAIFTIVMYIGCFAQDSLVKTWLLPIRAELSIMACILSLGHMIIYLLPYVPRLAEGTAGIDLNVFISFFIAIGLMIFLIILGATSFNEIKRRMSAQAWKRVQVWAYPFFILTYVHLLLILLPASIKGSEVAQINVMTYSLVFVVYIILRVRRAMLDKGQRVRSANSPS